MTGRDYGLYHFDTSMPGTKHFIYCKYKYNKELLLMARMIVHYKCELHLCCGVMRFT